MHPLIVLVSFILFAAFVALGDFWNSLVGIVLLLMVGQITHSAPSARAWKMLRRMKIFFLSIVLLYTWFTPGQLVFPILDNWSPTYEGLLLGSERILALIVLVFAVDSFLNVLGREKILVALYYFFAPLQSLGFDRERFMLRTLLTLEATTQTEFKLRDLSKSLNPAKSLSGYINQLALMLKSLFETPSSHTIQSAEIVIDIDGPPPARQWLLPCCVTVLFLGVALC